MNELIGLYIKDKFYPFKNLLEKDTAAKIHVRNLQVLVTEMFKAKNCTTPKIISGIFKLSNPTYNLRKKRDFASNHVKTIYFCIQSLSYLGQNYWMFYLRT